MAHALGYRMIGRESVSGSGSTKSSKWMLIGKGNIKTLVPEALSIDEDRGEIRVPKHLVGRVIGSGGHRIQTIQKLTSRIWRVVGE